MLNPGTISTFLWIYVTLGDQEASQPITNVSRPTRFQDNCPGLKAKTWSLFSLFECLLVQAVPLPMSLSLLTCFKM